MEPQIRAHVKHTRSRLHLAPSRMWRAQGRNSAEARSREERSMPPPARKQRWKNGVWTVPASRMPKPRCV
eukprot:6202838-Pleurochrysis_carterae.AAC.2